MESDIGGIFWLGCQDSNLGMQAPKACVLPLDDTPVLIIAVDSLEFFLESRQDYRL